MTTHCKHCCVTVLLMMALVTGCGQQSFELTELAPGQEPYLRYCGSCHGNAGAGKPPAFPPLDGSQWLELPPEGLALIVLYGLRGEIEVAGRTYRGFMPPMRHISNQDIAAIIGFMDSNWVQREPGLDADDVAALRSKLAGRPPAEGWQGVTRLLEEYRE